MKVILDCDPGHDDAIAIILAASKISPLDIVGITTVSGNVEVEKNTLNALKICDIIGLDDVPVAQGATRPMVKKSEIAEEIHGETGLDGPNLPLTPKKAATSQHAIDFIIEQLHNSAEPITLVPTGPLTNIAMALVKDPSIKKNINEIVLMGGGTFGNWTPAAEFNIYVDAEAAKVVFESGILIRMFGLDVTHQVLATKETVGHLREINNPVSEFVAELLVFFMQAYKDHFDFPGGPIHDACTVAHLLDPTIFEFEHVHVAIETKGEHTYGMTAVDRLGVTGREPNTYFATGLDQGKFWRLFKKAMESYSD
ncbi:Inosine-uridine nucleoside N-ribohydrolase [Gracilibacillus orientalis]|uniref:Inosine-uridine nucleoside N-ribohydrolase n=1 Tax=Gracilibacillus orientalis TaxID=334253 RepID=A0A1I4NCH7_9BACI|nr:nucleoside hydrolase [Gracilibacillus orientalis]SFM12933.1 Inosine-uridine nucleoside N-ribohydrolase [Gracilibacillus orientalis]